MKHRHHIIPRHMGGTNDPDNLVLLTVEEHAEAHKALFDEHGRWQDKIAWQMLSGIIGIEDAVLQTQIEGGKKGGKARPNAEARRKIGQAQIGNQKAKGHIHTPEEIRKMKVARNNRTGKQGMEGKTHTAASKAKMSEAAKRRWARKREAASV